MMTTQAQPKFGAAPYLAASTANPQASNKRRLTRTDMVLHVGNARITFSEVTETANAPTPAPVTTTWKDSQELAQHILKRFTTITAEFDEEYQESRGCRVNFDGLVPDTGMLTRACFILGSLGYVAIPEGEAPYKSVWVKHVNF